jgi:hypothetical protein
VRTCSSPASLAIELRKCLRSSRSLLNVRRVRTLHEIMLAAPWTRCNIRVVYAMRLVSPWCTDFGQGALHCRVAANRIVCSQPRELCRNPRCC